MSGMAPDWLEEPRTIDVVIPYDTKCGKRGIRRTDNQVQLATVCGCIHHRAVCGCRQLWSWPCKIIQLSKGLNVVSAFHMTDRIAWREDPVKGCHPDPLHIQI